MNLYEYQGKALLAEVGIQTPAGEVVKVPTHAPTVTRRLGGSSWVVKAQIVAGGRGRGFLSGNRELSGVCYAHSPEQAEQLATSMLGQTLITEQTGQFGSKIRLVYIERAEKPERMIAVSVLVDTRINQPVLIYTAHGGSEIEQMARENPDRVYRQVLALDGKIAPETVTQICNNLDIADNYAEQVGALVEAMMKLFIERDATLVEINPLALIDGRFIALDAKIALDQKALYRQPGNHQLSFDNYQNVGRYTASSEGFNYFMMDGDIGCLAVGAGLSMATVDALKHLGARPANFLDLPPDSGVTRTHTAIRLVLRNEKVKVLLINVFGGGIMRCDTIADALLVANREEQITIPMVVRLAGTNSGLAIRRIKESLPQAEVFSSLQEAAACAAEHAK